MKGEKRETEKRLGGYIIGPRAKKVLPITCGASRAGEQEFVHFATGGLTEHSSCNSVPINSLLGNVLVISKLGDRPVDRGILTDWVTSQTSGHIRSKMYASGKDEGSGVKGKASLANMLLSVASTVDRMT